MNRISVIVVLLVIFLFSCDKEIITKPEKLIKEKQMIDMMVDLYLAEATFYQMRGDSLVRNSSSANFYYSILEKYHIPDSVFEKSYIYYACQPKLFESMKQKVINKLSEIEQSNSGRKREEVNVNPNAVE